MASQDNKDTGSRELTTEQRALLEAALLRAASSWASMAAETHGQAAVNFATRADAALDLWGQLRTCHAITVTP